MVTIVPPQPIASAYFVIFGNYGDVTRYAQERGVCRQWVYREAQKQQQQLLQMQQEVQRLQTRVRALEQLNADQAQRLKVAVILDADKQAEFASVSEAMGVSLPTCRIQLDVLIPGQVPSVATLGRRTHQAGEKSGPLLKVFDEFTHPLVRDAAADEIYVSAPTLMVVEQESMCWVSGRLSEQVNGAAWQQEFQQLPNLEQVARDGGKGLAKGVALVNAKRQEQNQPLVVDQGDHFHAVRLAGVGLRKVAQKAHQAFACAEEAQKELERCKQQGEKATIPGATGRANAAWYWAEKAMDTWIERDRAWQKTKGALQLITPEGELNTRQHAEAVLAETLGQLPDSDFAKVKAALQKPEMLNYLDHVQKQIEALPFPEEVKKAAVRQECLRRSPALLKGEKPSAGALRGVMLLCAVVLGKTETVSSEAVAAVRSIFRRAYRASSLVECLNSVLRMQQSRHRKMTQGMLDLKRLYWNSHTFRTGRRRNTSPYQRLGVPWPEGMRWWDVLKLTPEQLRDKLSTAKIPP